MLRVALHIEYADGSAVDAVATAADQMAFEEHFDKPITVISNEFRVTYLLWLAWHVIKRTGKTSDDCNKWAEDVASVSIGDADDVVPLESKAPIGS